MPNTERKSLLPLLLVLSLGISQILLWRSDAFAATNAEKNLTAIPFTDTKLVDQFWAPRLEINRDVTVWYDFKKCEETGRIDNFSVAGKLKPGLWPVTCTAM